jgi:hypothetical protein
MLSQNQAVNINGYNRLLSLVCFGIFSVSVGESKKIVQSNIIIT